MRIPIKVESTQVEEKHFEGRTYRVQNAIGTANGETRKVQISISGQDIPLAPGMYEFDEDTHTRWKEGFSGSRRVVEGFSTRNVVAVRPK